jgi:hypothetical protein
MSILEFLESITEDQIGLLIREYEAMPQPDHGQACLRARIAAAQNRKATWSIYSMAHVNALLIGLNRIKYSQSYDVIRLIAMVECFSFGLMGQGGLTYQDFNLAIGPLAAVLAPELFAQEQTWTPEPVAEFKYARPYRPESYRSRKRKLQPEEGIDLGQLVDSLVRETKLAAPAPRTFQAEPDQGDQAVNALLESIKNL